MANTSSLSLRDNLILKMLNDPERSDVVWGSDMGYNKLQQITALLNAKSGGAKRVYDQKFYRHKIGNLGISAKIQSVTTSGAASGNIIVTFTQKVTNFREKDIVMDSNAVQGKVVRQVSDTSIELYPVSVTFSTSTHFTAGQTAKVLFDASPNRGSRGKSSLTVMPDSEYNYTGVSRETNNMYINDGIKSYPKWKGKNWYTSHQEMTLNRFGKSKEWKNIFSERAVLHAGTKDETFTTGGLRWQIINGGGTYMQLTGKITRNDWHDTINQLMRKTANNGRNMVALMGQQFISDIQDLSADAITYTGQNSTFGGQSVRGFDVRRYDAAGMSIEFDRYALFDDPEMFPEISDITGKPRWSTTCLLLDLSPVPSADGQGMIPAIQEKYFGAVKTRMKYLPGMMSLDEMNDEAAAEMMKSGDFSLAVSDLDSCQFELYENQGWEIIPEKCALIELAA